MKICIIATHSYPIPYKIHTGDVVILDLAKSLQAQGHDVWLCAPQGTDFLNLIPMRASYGKYPPSSEECELEAFTLNADKFASFDIVHDFSVTKKITQKLNKMGFGNTCSTLLGGPWRQELEPHNLIVWSENHRQRVLRGATDFENTSDPKMGGEPGFPVRDAHIVHGGINTGFYTPDKYQKGDFFLWMGRWHPARGYRFAIELAKATGIKLVMSGEHPDNEVFENQRACAMDALMLAAGYGNISFEWLPKDPEHHLAKRELLRQAKALLYTVQFHEPFGLSQVEALACGTPVIANNFGSCPELITKNVGIIANNNLEEWSEALLKIGFIDPVSCRKNATGRFDRQLMARNYMEQYEKIRNGEQW